MRESFSVRELLRTDIEALLAFETQNRAWFESHIDARAPSFYSVEGVTEHIDGYLSDFARGVWHPFVIEDSSGRIVGRANLKGIDTTARLAEVGYRIAQSACGQGLATHALEHLIGQAQTRWALTQLVAYVFPENAGSTKVLERCGFLPEPPLKSDAVAAERRFVRAI
ncbi:GNAT family N-acetyltransferase [Pseudomonas abietaniphila]|uniref:Ribosomal-protein-alanine N-acetyltransferase n=1 Tax=Pseudomonas abietaniphila TaxID=89065 RepID=A0A1G8GFX8_9PSED|nr:GNAT family N-acetyltransferase [Pseudomonas abietaniphila]SDH93329.1 ribosomal-protein-alanine N-acetyltransferase [Pseudomonas abietaniphila]